MKKIIWDHDKSNKILSDPARAVSLDLIAELIQSGSVLSIIQRPQYPDQKCFLVLVYDYVWCVPFREYDDHVFLITAWPDRKFNKEYSK